jgi:hypothetical protein
MQRQNQQANRGFGRGGRNRRRQLPRQPPPRQDQQGGAGVGAGGGGAPLPPRFRAEDPPQLPPQGELPGAFRPAFVGQWFVDRLARPGVADRFGITLAAVRAEFLLALTALRDAGAWAGVVWARPMNTSQGLGRLLAYQQFSSPRPIPQGWGYWLAAQTAEQVRDALVNAVDEQDPDNAYIAQVNPAEVPFFSLAVALSRGLRANLFTVHLNNVQRRAALGYSAQERQVLDAAQDVTATARRLRAELAAALEEQTLIFNRYAASMRALDEELRGHLRPVSEFIQDQSGTLTPDEARKYTLAYNAAVAVAAQRGEGIIDLPEYLRRAQLRKSQTARVALRERGLLDTFRAVRVTLTECASRRPDPVWIAPEDQDDASSRRSDASPVQEVADAFDDLLAAGFLADLVPPEEDHPLPEGNGNG